MAQRLTSRGMTNRLRLIEAAAAEIVDSGVEGANLDRILARAGARSATFNWMFRSIDELLTATVRMSVDEMAGIRHDAIANASGPAQSIAAQLTAAASWMTSDRLGAAVYRVVWNEPRWTRLLAAEQAEARRRLAAEIQAAQEEGTALPGDPDGQADAAMAVITRVVEGLGPTQAVAFAFAGLGVISRAS